MQVIVKGTPDEVYVKYQRFLEEWWLDNCWRLGDEVHLGLNIHYD